MRIGILDIFHITTVLLYEYKKDIGAVFCRTCICVCRRTARDYSNVRLFTAQIMCMFFDCCVVTNIGRYFSSIDKSYVILTNLLKIFQVFKCAKPHIFVDIYVGYSSLRLSGRIRFLIR